MKLSEAIRLGSMIRPQVYGGLFGYVRLYGAGGVTSVIGSCALGAAWEASGGSPDCYSKASEGVRAQFPILESEAKAPVDTWSSFLDVEGIVITLNDAKRWTREQIADWVESVEMMHESELQDVRETTNV